MESPYINSPYTLFIFDWDGTLIDSEAKIIAAFRAAADDLGLSYPSDQNIRDIIGSDLPNAIRTLFPSQQQPFLLRVLEQYRHHLRVATPPNLFPGVPETLRKLRDNRFLIAVATSNSRNNLEQDLLSTGLGQIFQATRCAGEAPAKPNPQMLHEIMTELQVQPERTLLIGDSIHDLQMAQNAGIDAIAATYGVLHDKARLLQYQPRAGIDAIGELIDWLARSS
uniref:Phosphoglycolate phosphatase n=1 Tax=Candidatus Kentrum sp. MB TaxID=2138164 RepID=A0A450Y2N0_9GAMM|nr:MAG: phosphoglycolate phosphatase [Candidatus Kentron sp. MB]VFK35808.1 MAG: phosphoglycolate phosphatase [Candidatus Kentron sp. MB]VFK76446.1 MAG: phosphoglycolate phosphatase [Candidatus Kentron sp. MB]